MAEVWALARSAAPFALPLSAALALVTGLLPVSLAWLTKLLLDDITHHAAGGRVVAAAGGVAGVGAATAVMPQLAQFLQAHLDREVGLVAQDRLFAAVERFTGLGRFEEPRFQDRLHLARQAGATSVSQALYGVLLTGQTILTSVGFLCSLLALNPWMSAIVVAVEVPLLFAEIRLSRRRAAMAAKIAPVERREFFYASLLSSAETAKEVRLFSIGAFLRGRMKAERRTANTARGSMDRRERRVQSILALTAALAAGGGLLWAALAARAGAISVGSVTLFAAAVAGLQAALMSLVSTVARTHHALLMFRHYQSVTTAGPDLPVVAAPAATPVLRTGIELRDVWFRYSDDHPWVLRGVNLRIPAGTSLALVGLNGAGKSTLVKLLCRFYDPTRGAVLWDGIDLRELDPAELRRHIGAVFQDYMKYDLTAAENIGLGDPRAMNDRSRVEEAARRAGLHDVLANLPFGYDTLLSRVYYMGSDQEDSGTGVVLSGGQWQRLALARAFLRDQRDLMILDEPSSGLDAEAEHEIHTSLRLHRRNRTSLLITHRLGAIRDADHIVVLADGRVAEEGDHIALLAADGAYARLYNLQASGYQEQEPTERTMSEA